MHRRDHRDVDFVAPHVANEGTVDLQVVDLQVLQVTEGREADAEVVEREATAVAAEPLDEALGIGQAVDGRALGDFEYQLVARDVPASELFFHEPEEGATVHGLAGQVHREGADFLERLRMAADPVEHLAYHPLVEFARALESLQRRDEFADGELPLLTVVCAEQNLVVRRLTRARRQRDDRLAAQV